MRWPWGRSSGLEADGVKIVVGLGNPGPRYANTRHNVAWWLLDGLADAWKFRRSGREKGSERMAGRRGEYPVHLVKPLTYMNRSGGVVATLARRHGVDVQRDLLVVVDDVALAPGRARFRAAGSSGGHNGLRSVEQALGTRDYPRLRIGVGSAPPGVDMADWVLSPFDPKDRDAVESVLPPMYEAVEHWLSASMVDVMSRYNR